MTDQKSFETKEKRFLFRPMWPTLAATLLAGFLLAAGPALASQTFYNIMKENVCTKMNTTMKITGCEAYMIYRIAQFDTKDKAQERCIWRCGVMFESKPDVAEQCRQGCSETRNMDD